MMSQLDLFSETLPHESRDSLCGLVVHLPTPCRCGAAVATIGAGAGPHAAALCCAKCETHRGWLAHETHRFITEFIKTFGRPAAPIAIRRSERRQPNISRVAGARRAQMSSNQGASRGDVMDMREFRKTKFLKIDDCREPRQRRIADCVPGKYSKPDLVFENGDRLGLSATNVEILSDAYGFESAQWAGHVIELGVGIGKFDGEDVEMIIVKPISKAAGGAQATESVKRAPNKPPELKSQASSSLDDQADF
jgi:hypothetical protein